MIELRVPWAAVRELRAEERTLPSTIRNLQRTEVDGSCQLHVAVSARTNVTAELHEPTLVRTPRGDEEVVSVSFWVDEPRPFVRTVRRQGAAGLTRRRPS
ncbi:MAG TPA: hypothetical protein VFG72_15225 [Marmoricola sp.]|nr:hypothetical protein [Marmoricola sp.]